MALAVAAMTPFTPSRAEAAAYQVQARTEAQAYDFRSYRGTHPDAPVLLPRRRVVQYLGANGFELVTGEDVGFESSLRIYADVGFPRGEAERIDGARSEDLDLLYANVHYRTESFEGRLGRQVYIDIMDYMAFDGLRARYLRRIGPRVGSLGGEVYGGLWVKGASLLGSSVYQLDGTRESDARRIALGVAGADPLLDDIEPVFGFKLLGEDLGGLGIATSLGYRRSILGGKITSERAAVELRYGSGRGFNGWTGVDYDLFQGRLAQARSQFRYDATLWAASLEFLRFQPTYTADSIFYYFVSAPRDEIRLRGDFLPPGAFRFYGTVLQSTHHTVLNTDEDIGKLDPSTFPDGGQLGAGGGVAARFSQTRTAVDLTWRNGYGGRQLWLDLTGGFTSGDQLYTVDARLSIASIQDELNPLLRGNFYGMQLWGSYAVSPASRLSVVLEENVNPFTKSDTKVFVLFDLRADL